MLKKILNFLKGKPTLQEELVQGIKFECPMILELYFVKNVNLSLHLE